MSEKRLSDIDTLWTMVSNAHEQPADSRARSIFFEQYGPAARRYLLGAVRDADVADELYQDFAVKFLRGDFRDVDPERGRFRSFLKSVLYRMVADHFRKRKRQRQSPTDLEAAPVAHVPNTLTRRFAMRKRDELLGQAWSELKKREQTSGKPLHTTLLLRTQNPNLRSPGLAEVLSQKLSRPITRANVRVMLFRAREQFATILLNLVAGTLSNRSAEQLEEELASLGLLGYCRSAIKKYRGDNLGMR